MNIDQAYQILKVSENISEEELKKKFKRLVLKYHPDRNKETDTTKKFIEISEAYKKILESREEPNSWIDNFNFANPYENMGSTFRTSTWTFTFSNG